MPSRIRRETVIAALGATLIPLLALGYLSTRPGRGTLGYALVQGALVVGGAIGAIFFLSRLLDQVRANRVGRWLDTDEGRDWLDGLPEGERAAFEEQWDRYR